MSRVTSKEKTISKQKTSPSISFKVLSELFFPFARKNRRSCQNCNIGIFRKILMKNNFWISPRGFSVFLTLCQKKRHSVEKFPSGLSHPHFARPEKFFCDKLTFLSKKFFCYHLWTLSNFFVVLQNSLVRCVRTTIYVWIRKNLGKLNPENLCI